MKKLLLFVVFLLPSWLLPKAPIKAAILDFGGVTLSSSKIIVAHDIGLGSLTSYFFKQGSSPQTIFNIAMDVLDAIEPLVESDNEPYAYLSGKKIRRLPTLYCQWLDGSKKSREIKKAALKKIKELSDENYFSSRMEKKLTIKTIKSMLNPKLIACATKRIKRGKYLAQDLAKKGYDLYILSNWDNESFSSIYKNPKNKKLFKLFKKERILISGEIGDYKPHTSIFKSFLERFNLDAQDCIFIDDQEENIIAARSLGIKSFHLRNKHYKELRTELKKENIL